MAARRTCNWVKLSYSNLKNQKLKNSQSMNNLSRWLQTSMNASFTTRASMAAPVAIQREITNVPVHRAGPARNVKSVCNFYINSYS